jgi:hypothetical protein
MPPTPVIVLEIDDNTPCDLAPFTNDVSMWSFEDDFNLGTRTAAETFRAIHEALGGSKFRSYPERVARTTFELLDGLVGAEEVTWLTGAELAAVGPLLPTGQSSVEKSLRMLFETVCVAGRHFGPDRVRLVFAFS